MTGPEKFAMEPYENRLFDEAFSVSSYNQVKGRLMGIELRIRHNEKEYLLEVKSFPLYLAGLAELEPGEEADTEKVLMLPGGEILPTDLLAIKTTPFDELQQYLVEQSEDS